MFTTKTPSLIFRTPAYSGDFRVYGLCGREALSSLFWFRINLAAQDDAIDLGSLLGQQAEITIKCPYSTRTIRGLISSFSRVSLYEPGLNDENFTPYVAQLVPNFWLLTQRATCRIFQNKATPEIIDEVLRAAGVGEEAYQFRLHGPSYPTREYCVQYRERDWRFISRLMEEEGIFYFFEYRDGRDVLIFGNGTSVYAPIVDQSDVLFHDLSGLQPHQESIRQFRSSQQVGPTQISFREYNFEHPSLDLAAQAAERDAARKLDLYDYPGRYLDEARGHGLARIQLEAEQVVRARCTGKSDSPRFLPGHTFRLTLCPQTAHNQTYLLTDVRHSATAPLGSHGLGGQFTYENTFCCIPATYVYRSRSVTPKPVVMGPQTAVVVGPKGEEIYADQYGRVKVQFHWDRAGARNEHSSCWIRGAQSSAGRGWGAMCLPRIGQEVVVEHLEGNPDRPLITGVVYNADQMPPYRPDIEGTKSYVKTNSSPGGDGFNEIRIEDKLGQEQIFVHAQRQMDVRVRGDRIEQVVGSRHLTVGHEKDGEKVGDKVELVHGDSHITVRRHEIERIEGNKQLLVGRGEEPGGGNLDVIVDKNRTELVGEDAHEHVVGDRKEQVDGAVSCTVKGDCQQRVQQNYVLEAGAAYHLKTGAELVIEGGTIVTLKGPGGFINIDSEGITIQGNMVKVNCGGSPTEGIAAAPRLPQDPMEAKPQKPRPADDAKTGRKSAPE